MTHMSKLIVDYIVVEAYSPEDLAAAVSQRIDDGWQPYGSLAMTEPRDSSRQCMVQPMVLFEEDLV